MRGAIAPGRSLRPAPLLALVTVIVLLPGWMRPELTRARIRTAIVQVGPIEAVITASGTVVPEIERALSSPVDAKLLRLRSSRARR